MGILKKVENTTAFLKVGMLGFAGSGKTHTAMLIAIGLNQQIKNKKIAFFDTEKGSEFHKKRAEAAGMEFASVRSRSFVDLIETMQESEKEGYGVLIIDSISHVWKNLMDSYLAAKGRKFISLPDWGPLKGQWSEFSDLYVNSNLHIIMCGRAADTYDNIENEVTHKLESVKVGVKMRAETETGYEPDLLVYMDRISETQRTKGKKKGSVWTHRATILKDRTDLLNGHTFDNPTFASFKPVVDFLNIGGTHTGIDTSHKSSVLFDDNDRSWEQKKMQRQILLERLDETLVLAGMAGTSGKAKEDRTKLLVEVFGTASKTYLEEKTGLDQLRDGIEVVREKIRAMSAATLNAPAAVAT